MDIFEMLKNAGAEVPEDKRDAFNAEFRKTYKSEAEVAKKVGAAEKERDSWKERAETAESLFNAIVKDKEGKLLPNIIVEESQQQAEQRRSGIVGRSINSSKSGESLSTAELMRMKNENPNLDISQYLK